MLKSREQMEVKIKKDRQWNEMNIHRFLRQSGVVDSNFSKCLNKNYIVPHMFTLYLSPQDLPVSIKPSFLHQILLKISTEPIVSGFREHKKFT